VPPAGAFPWRKYVLTIHLTWQVPA
jgi:hypothetical protein